MRATRVTVDLGPLDAAPAPPAGSLAWLSGVLLAVLVFSGQLKVTVLFSWLPIDLTLASAGLVLVAIVVSWVRQGAPSRRILLPIGLWVAFLFPLLNPPMGALAVAKVQLLFTVTLLIAVAPFFLLRSRAQKRGFLFATIGLGILAAYVVATSGSTVAGFSSRFVLEGTDTIGTARLAAAAALTAVFLALVRAFKFGVRLLLFALGGGLALLAFSAGSRGPVLGAALAILVALLVAPQFRKYRVRVAGASLLLAAAAAAAAAVSAEAFGRIAEYLQGTADSSIAGRDQLTAEAWRLAGANPGGIGWGNFQFEGGLFTYPHNTYLEVLVEAGWFIALVFASLTIFAAIRLLRVEPTPESLAFFGLLVFAAVNAYVSSNLIGNRLLIVMVFAAFVPPIAARVRRTSAAGL